MCVEGVKGGVGWWRWNRIGVLICSIQLHERARWEAYGLVELHL